MYVWYEPEETDVFRRRVFYRIDFVNGKVLEIKCLRDNENVPWSVYTHEMRIARVTYESDENGKKRIWILPDSEKEPDIIVTPDMLFEKTPTVLGAILRTLTDLVKEDE